jgi:hypothetical protein
LAGWGCGASDAAPARVAGVPDETPFFLYLAHTAPHWPAGFAPRSTAHAACHVVDILPTILAVTGSAYQREMGGHDIQPMQGGGIPVGAVQVGAD